MSYEKTVWSNGATALSAEHMNHLEQGVFNAHEVLATIVNGIYPVGSILMTTENVNPNTRPLLQGTTWVKWGAGKVPVGVDTTQAEFDTVEESGGGKTKSYTPSGSVNNHVLTVSEMPSHTHTQNSHTHTQNAHTHGTQYHSHTMDNGNGYFVEVPKSGSGFGRTEIKGGTQGSTYNDIVQSSSVISRFDTTTPSSVTVNAATATNNSATATNQNTGGGGGHNHGFTGTASSINVLQPYITCYMWKRTE